MILYIFVFACFLPAKVVDGVETKYIFCRQLELDKGLFINYVTQIGGGGGEG